MHKDFGETRFILFDGRIVPIVRGRDGIWRDAWASEYAFEDASGSFDKVVRCGIWPAVLPTNDPATDACRPHDYIGQSPLYQKYHTFSDAQDYLESLVSQIPGREQYAGFFAWLTGIWRGWWEDKSTRYR